MKNQTDKPSADAPIELRVVEALKQDGFEAIYEHPGYVEVVQHGGRVWAFGTIDESWGGHRIDAEQDFVTGSEVDLGVPSDYCGREAVGVVARRIGMVLRGCLDGLAADIENEKLRTALTNLVNGVKELHPDASTLGGLEEAEAILGKEGQ